MVDVVRLANAGQPFDSGAHFAARSLASRHDFLRVDRPDQQEDQQGSREQVLLHVKSGPSVPEIVKNLNPQFEKYLYFWSLVFLL